MKKRVVCYLRSVPDVNGNENKEIILRKFVLGINRTGDTGILHEKNYLVNCDVGVIQGWIYKNISPPHLKLRNDVINTQLVQNKYVLTADANLFFYVDISNKLGYLRYSFNGVFPRTGIYCDDRIDPGRWRSIQSDTGIQLEDYRTNGKHIVLMLQRQNGWSMGGKDVVQWASITIKRLRQYTDRPIVIRPHPNDKRATVYLKNTKLTNFENVAIGNIHRPLETDIKNAWAVINYNSSAIVGPIIKGYHAFVTDPKSSQCAEVTNHDLSLIENPETFDRQRWLERVSMFHWKFDELEDGSCWRHMRDYC